MIVTTATVGETRMIKQGRFANFDELRAEVERVEGAKRDFVAPTDKLSVELRSPEEALEELLDTVDTSSETTALNELLNAVDLDKGSDPDPALMIPHLIINGQHVVTIGKVAHEQICARLKIGAKYYNRMKDEAPDLLATNINHWLHEQVERRMVRTLDNNARAFLSDRYRPLDNLELLAAVTPALAELDVRVLSCDITDRRLYIKVMTPRIQGEVKVGDIVCAGMVISNSEVGCGALKVEPLIFRLVCLNGAIMPINNNRDTTMRKYHVGRGFDTVEGAGAFELFRDETRRQDDKAFFMKVRDVVSGTIREDLFNMDIEKIRESVGRGIEKTVKDTVDEVTARYSFNEAESDMVLQEFAGEGDLTQWGMANAITAASQVVEDYERATEFERIGGEVMSLPATVWSELAA
jgi:hypothetical protein